MAIGRIYINDKPSDYPDNVWPIQVSIVRQLAANNVKASVHSPRYYGISYCKACGNMHVKPETKVYNGTEFYKCNCGQINYIK